MVLYSRFKPYDNCDCYAQAIIMLRDLYKLGKENVDPNTAMTEINDIKSKILALHMKFPQNRFATKCIDYVERFVQQIFERGVFEVSILNIDRHFDGVVYYQVRNKGYELISNIALTFAIENASNTSNTIEQVRINSIIPEGLRPNQVYAGEYAPDADFEDGTEIGCSITVEYSVVDEDGQEVYKNYVAVDPNTSGKLIVVHNNINPYQKDGPGYNQVSIKKAAEFIGRKKELTQIMGKVLKCRNALLFGTNGTGKTSILQNIQTVCLPDAYSDESQRLGRYFSAALKFDKDCTERNVLESIVNSVCCDTRFEIFIRRNGNEETQDILALAAEKWTANVEKIFDEDGNCTDTNAVKQYFLTLDDALSSSNLDIYILIDQFEQVISSKHINSVHMEFLGGLTCQRICFILAGSNYLLEEVAVDKINKKEKTSWREIFSRGFEPIKIGNMYQEDFKLLITQKDVLNGGEIRYTPEALDYLWQFTKGHTFYSCLLGNRTLDIMSSRRVKRNVIYPSDIFIAIYQPLKYLPKEESNNDKEIAIKDQIFKDIIDNTPIKLVGKTLAKMQSSGERKVSYQKLKDYIEEYRPDILEDFDDALSVLVARDFITYYEIDIQRQSDRSQSEDLRTAREYFFTSDLYLEHFATVHVPELSTPEREAIESKNQSIDELVTDLRTRKFSAEDIGRVRDALKEFGNNGPTTVINTETVVGTNSGAINSQKIGTQNVVNINAQTINSFSTLLTGDCKSPEFVKAFSEMPGISAYLGDNHQKVLALQDDISTCLDENGEIIYDTMEGYENRVQLVEKKYEEIEQLVTPAMERRMKDISSVVTIDDFVSTSEELWIELLKVDDKTVKKLKALPTQYSAALGFAVVIHNVFDKIYKNSEQNGEVNADDLDFCPVAILYCKIVEAMLKEEHTSLYASCFASRPIDSRKASSPLFEEVDKNNPALSIGTYLYFLSTVNINKISNQKAYERLPQVRFVKDAEITELSKYTSQNKSKWFDHACQLPIIVSTRNKSAHEIQPIKKDRFDWLIDVLFVQGELMRIWELSQDYEI